MPIHADRISEMEARLKACAAATADLAAQLDRMDALREDMIALFRYYGSEAWYEDRDAWESAGAAGRPEGVSAGVLSEDLVYDEITEARDAAFHMLELATDILKNRI